jgi:YggT family protein
MLQMFRADFYNPVSQFIVKVTSPPLKYLRRGIPSLAGQDTSAIVLCLLITFVKFVILRLLDIEIVDIGNTVAFVGSVSYLGLLIYSIADLISLFLSIFLIAILIQVIMSWINPGNYNPVIGLVNTLATPALRPIQKLIPPIGGLDISPLFAMLAIVILKMLLIPPIMSLANQ